MPGAPAEGQGRAAAAVAGDPGAGRGGRRPADRRAGGAADRPGRGAAHVKELFHAATDRRVPRLVLVSGPAGVGKSRLGWEFEKYIDGLAADVWWHRGRCLSYGEGVAFWALAEIVRSGWASPRRTPPRSRRRSWPPGWTVRRRSRASGLIGARLGRLLGVAVRGGGWSPLSREELFAGWRLFFERLAAQQPVVLLVEDAQYADAGLLDFLEH